ncbi:MAG: hypothetical protein LBV67_01220 [Streptococcaceae bacterium]|jgi:hypothetical protein|nr:hypothetical protein [Streptococcaceae bacterium]
MVFEQVKALEALSEISKKLSELRRTLNIVEIIVAAGSPLETYDAQSLTNEAMIAQKAIEKMKRMNMY